LAVLERGLAIRQARSASRADSEEEQLASMGSVIKKRRKKIRKHKYKKLRKRMRHKR